MPQLPADQSNRVPAPRQAPAPDPHQFFDATGGEEYEPVEPTPEPPKPVHPQWALDAARELGYSELEIQSATPEQLTAELHRAQRALLRRQQEAARFDATRQDVERRPQPAPQSAPEEDEFDLAEADYDPKVYKLLKTLHAENKALKKHVSGLSEREEKRTTGALFEKFDEAFAALPDDLLPLFGDGGGSDLDPKSDEMLRRRAVLAATGLTPDQAATMGQTAFNRAVHAVVKKMFAQARPAQTQPAAPADPYGNPLGGGAGERQPPGRQTPPKDPVTGRFVSPEEWNASALARPTQRSGADDERPGLALATRNLAARLREARSSDNGLNGTVTKADFLPPPGPR